MTYIQPTPKDIYKFQCNKCGNTFPPKQGRLVTRIVCPKCKRKIGGR